MPSKRSSETTLLLALDLASKTGFAYGKIDCPMSRISSGTQDFHFLAEERHGSRMLRFTHWLSRTVTRCPSLIIVERAHHRGWDATLNSIGLYSHLDTWAVQEGVPIITVASSTLKKFATGSGRSNKDDMITAARTKWPSITLQSDDHADALHLFNYGKNLLQETTL